MNEDNKISIDLKPFLQSTSQMSSGTTNSKFTYLFEICTKILFELGTYNY